MNHNFSMVGTLDDILVYCSCGWVKPPYAVPIDFDVDTEEGREELTKEWREHYFQALEIYTDEGTI